MSVVTSERPAAVHERTHSIIIESLIVLGWFVAAGVIGAVVWLQVTDLPVVTKVDGSAVLDPQELVKQVGIDGWYFVIAAVGGLLSGGVLTVWRHRDALLTVVLVTLGAGLAAYLMLRAGQLFGPGDEAGALRELADGGTVSMQLTLHAPGVAWVWPIAAAAGAMLVLWVTPERHEGDQ